jgi:hypothetical protein
VPSKEGIGIITTIVVSIIASAIAIVSQFPAHPLGYW